MLSRMGSAPIEFVIVVTVEVMVVVVTVDVDCSVVEVEVKVLTRGNTTVAQASATSPPDLFWSPSCTMSCSLYVWPVTIRPMLMRVFMSQRISAPYPWFVSPLGAASPPSKFQLFVEGSELSVTVLVAGFVVLS